MRIEYDPAKRESNVRKHGLDPADAARVFEGITYTIEDRRYPYPEQRFVTFGLLAEVVVAIAHTEERKGIRVISMRKATRNEQAIYFENI